MRYLILALALAGLLAASGALAYSGFNSMTYGGTETAMTLRGFSTVTGTGGGGPQDGAVGLGLFNNATTDGNYSYICLGSKDTAGRDYCGAMLVAKFQKHGAAGSVKYTEFRLFLQMEHTESITEVAQWKWDHDQNGPVFALGIEGKRQGLNLAADLPLAFYDKYTGALVTTFKCGLPMTCQIGDSITGPSIPSVLQAPVVAGGVANVAGVPFIIKGGGSTGIGEGGPVQFWVAQAGVSGTTPHEPVLVAEVTSTDFLVNGVSFNDLVARVAALEARLAQTARSSR